MFMLNERKYTIETEQETDGRWIAEVLEMSKRLHSELWRKK